MEVLAKLLKKQEFLKLEYGMFAENRENMRVVFNGDFLILRLKRSNVLGPR